MSTLLFSLGRWSYRHPWRVLVSWVLLLGLAGGGALAFMKGTDNAFSIPGTEAQEGIQLLERTFPQASGTSAQIVIVADDGDVVTAEPYTGAIADTVAAFGDLDGVLAVTDPFDDMVSGLVSDDERAAIVRLQFDGQAIDVSEETTEALRDISSEVRAELPSGAQVALGGDLFGTSIPTLSIIEAVGVLIALFVLIVTFRSIAVAWFPLVSALIGVGLAIALIYAATAFTLISSTAPMLAIMLGLAVGIDYALFIVARHQDQVRAGVEPEESAARATGTAGSAVVFAGMTVLIALIGLAFAGIPFLTVMGIAAAAAVAIAVAVAVTLTPALLGFSKGRVVGWPRRARRTPKSDETDAAAPAPRPARRGFAQRWVTLVTRHPVVTTVAVVVGLGVVAVPAASLTLALPNAGVQPPSSEARQAYDLSAEHFGPGSNGPLIMTGTIVTSTDPLTLMTDIGDEVAKIPGVAEVALATPNETADTGLVQIVPETAPDDPATADLVRELRAQHDRLLDEYGVDLKVTGFTAVGIDISDRLGAALVPFGIFVVGLSLILLTIVFRSIWVPVTAAAGYLLSVAASFGVVAAVFEWGWFADLLHVARTGPVISFMPIILMGVLFGLAMDYEVFLVARMREDYVHSGKARESITTGFLGSAKVVTAAAIIMFAVFAAFVPEGDTNIKPIALGLAVGVFVDAFIVRMTLVPAVLALLGEKAWWIPKWLDRALPSFDVEGEGVAKEIELRNWPSPDSRDIATAEGLTLDADRVHLYENVSFSLPQDGTLVVSADREASVTALLLTLSGRMAADTGILKVAGYVASVRAASIRSRVAFVSLSEATDPVRDLTEALNEKPRLVAIDGIDQVTDAVTRRNIYDALVSAQGAAAKRESTLAVAVGTAFPDAIGDAVPGVESAVRIDLTHSELTHEAEVSA